MKRGGAGAMPRLLLINYEFPPLGGGAGNAAAHLARELAALGADVRVMTSAFAGLPDRETRDGVEIWRIPTLRRRADRSSVQEMLVFLASSLVNAPRLVAGWRPDLTIAFFGIPGGPAAWLLKALSGVPYVISLRGGDVPGFVHPGISFYHRLAGPVIGFLWRRARAVVANSRGLADLATGFAPDVAVAVTPNGVDAETFRPAAAGRGGGPAHLLFVGRLTHQKAVDHLLAALAALPDPAAARLRVVGDGPDRAALEAQAAALGLRDLVRFTGWAGRDELPAIYQDADIFVLPSRDEGMPNVVLEAMAAGLPVAATDVAGTRELVTHGKTGVLTAVGDVAGLAAALAGLIADPERRRGLGAAGRDRVLADYSWRSAAAAYLDWAARK